jgi:hypothetical protein
MNYDLSPDARLVTLSLPIALIPTHRQSPYVILHFFSLIWCPFLIERCPAEVKLATLGQPVHRDVVRPGLFWIVWQYLATPKPGVSLLPPSMSIQIAYATDQGVIVQALSLLA